MFSNTGYYSDFDLNLSYDDQEDFIICSCGHYRLLELRRLDTRRPAGRNDWQLIYMAAGRGHFELSGREREVGAENAVLYQPGQSQNYYYLLSDAPEVYWIHFSGSGCGKLLSELRLLDGSVYPVGKSDRYRELFEHIILELQLRRHGFPILCAAYARELFVRMSREYRQASSPSLSRDPYMNRIVEDMYREYREDIPIEEYARRYHMSVSWFIRRFRACFGETPQQYRIRIRMSQAGSLLESTSLSVGEIAVLTGYENPLYFSRLFRKCRGVSPTQYRRRMGGADAGRKE